MKKSAPVEQRLWAKVEKTDTCWLWRGLKFRSGYGRIGRNGKSVHTHRVSWELHNGPIPDGLFVCHKCDVPLCVNPAHLFLGTPLDNMRDMYKKGRSRPRRPLNGKHRGEGNPRAKLTQEKVAEIRRLLSAGQRPAVIAPAFGVAATTIYNIRAGETWSEK